MQYDWWMNRATGLALSSTSVSWSWKFSSFNKKSAIKSFQKHLYIFQIFQIFTNIYNYLQMVSKYFQKFCKFFKCFKFFFPAKELHLYVHVPVLLWTESVGDDVIVFFSLQRCVSVVKKLPQKFCSKSYCSKSYCSKSYCSKSYCSN
jgi:hypothetical protein